MSDEERSVAAGEALDRRRHRGPCDRFRLDYYVEQWSGSGSRPEWRYCECGWTEAHHIAEAAR